MIADRMMEHLEALEIMANALPDEIGVFRCMKATRSTSRATQAKAVAARVKMVEDRLKEIIEEARETIR